MYVYIHISLSLSIYIYIYTYVLGGSGCGDGGRGSGGGCGGRSSGCDTRRQSYQLSSKRAAVAVYGLVRRAAADASVVGVGDAFLGGDVADAHASVQQ